MYPHLSNSRRRERGVALLLTLFVVLIVATVILQLAVTTGAEYTVSANQMVVAKVDSALDVALVDARKALIDDAQQSQDGSGQGGGPGASMAGMPGGAQGMPGTGEEEKDDADTLNDPWSHDQETNIADVQIRVHVEDENRKFNILSIVSKDQDYARASRERLVRIIDMVREFNGSERDVDSATAEVLVANIQRWLDGERRDMKRPNLHSNKADSPVTLPLSLDELLLVEGVTEDLFYDQKHLGVAYSGLESVLTIWTSVEAGEVKKKDEPEPAPGSPNDPNNPANANAGAGATPGGSNTSNNTSGSQTPGAADTAQQPKDPAVTAGKSAGVKININTAPPCVLRALAPTFDIPTDVWDAIIRYRNKLDEEKMKKAQEAGEYFGGDLPPGVDSATMMVDRSSMGPGEQGLTTQYFKTLEDLEKVEEWKNCSNGNAKKDVLKLLTTKSDVFSIYITARPTEGLGAPKQTSVDGFGFTTTTPGSTDADDMPGGIVKRMRQIVWRRAGQEETVLLPLVVREERQHRKFNVAEFPIDPKTGRPQFR